MNRILHISFSTFMLLAIVCTAFPASPAGADGFIEVNSSADTTADDGSCTLREAITAANDDTSSGWTAGECAAGSGTDEITFAGNYTITLTAALPQVNSSMTIDGSGWTVVIDGVNLYRVFDVGPPIGNLTINHLSISNGNADTATGGGIRNFGTLVVANSTFSNNAGTWGGGIANESNGVISSITDSTFSGNQATSGGGGIYNGSSGTITSITGTTFSGNSATSGDGGGLINYGAITAIANSTFSDNLANGWGGGGILNAGIGTIDTIANSTLYDNSGPHGGGINNGGTINTIANTIVANNSGSNNCYGTASITDTKNLTDGSGCVTWGWDNTLDPASHLDPLADNGGPTQTIALLPGSPAIDAGDNATCAAAPVNNLDQRGKPRPVDSDANGSAICDIGAFEYQRSITATTLRSQKNYDGWVLESGEFTKKGGSKNSTGNILKVGDDASDRQYRAILSFSTAAIPDNAVITKVILKVKEQSVVGTNPMNTHNGLVVDIKTYKFFTLPGLQINDFQAKANKFKVGVFPKTPFSGLWYRTVLYKGAHAYINKKGRTQVRLRFTLDDNNDNGADIFKFYSGNAILANRPKLIVEYYVP